MVVISKLSKSYWIGEWISIIGLCLWPHGRDSLATLAHLSLSLCGDIDFLSSAAFVFCRVSSTKSTVLHAAVSSTAKDVVSLLLQHKADVNAENISGVSILHAAGPLPPRFSLPLCSDLVLPCPEL